MTHIFYITAVENWCFWKLCFIIARISQPYCDSASTEPFLAN
jgi:hypothetical protein